MWRLRNLTNKTVHLQLTISRKIFGFFESKDNSQKTPPPQQEQTKIQTYRQTIYENKKRELSKSEQYYIELKKERDQEDEQLMKRKRDIEVSENQVRKQGEVTLQTVDYKQIIISNIDLIPSKTFKDFNDFKETFKKIQFGQIRVTEENLVKVVNGCLDYADQMMQELVEMPLFDSLLDDLANSLGYFTEVDNIILVARFMDLYCLEKEELWGGLESIVSTKEPYMSMEQLIEVLNHISNQNEGSEHFYDKMEVRFTKDLSTIPTPKLVDILVAYYNHKSGRKTFVYDLLESFKSRMENGEALLEIPELTKLSIVITEMSEEFSSHKKAVFEFIEKNVFINKSKLTFQSSCLLAKGFGYENGSASFFKLLDQATLPELKEVDFEGFRNYVIGFLISYKISDQGFEILDSKMAPFLQNFTEIELAKIAKAYFTLGKENCEVVRQIEHKILYGLYNNGAEMDKETLFEIVHSYCITRIGSRELYRVLELVLVRRLKELAMETDLFDDLIFIYEETGLCSKELLKRMRSLK